MSTRLRFMVYNAFGIGGTVKTIFNFADYFQKTGKYDVEIVSIKKTREKPTLYLNPKVKITVMQDARRGAKYSDEDKYLLSQPSELIYPEEDLYEMFNAYTDKKLNSYLSGLNDGILVTTMPSFNLLAVTLVNDRVLKIGQEHKSFADHTNGIQRLICENYGKLDALTILTDKNKHVYERKIRGELPIYVLGNGTERLPFRANLKNHVIVAAGRYAEQKGYNLLIKAFALIAKQFPDWVVKIYGEGALTSSYIKLIHEYGLENQIVLESGSDRMDEKLSEASIHVCSSYYEPFGMVIIEGFAMGLPCISFACDGPREIITDGYDGLIVAKEDVKGLAEAMARVMSDDELRFKLGANAYETSKKYDIDVIGANFKKIIEKELPVKQGKLKETADKVAKSSAVVQVHSTDADEGRKYVHEDTANIDMCDTYSQMVAAASEGKVGLKTIYQMLKGWFGFKLWEKRNNEE